MRTSPTRAAIPPLIPATGIAAQLAAARPEQSQAPLPVDASHWDSLPQEIRDMIIAAAYPLLHPLNFGRLLPIELERMSWQRKERLWSEVFLSEWTGDLSLLPRISVYSEAFLDIRSRSMLDRAVAAGAISVTRPVMRLYVRNRWSDLFGGMSAQELAETAAEEHAVWLLEQMVGTLVPFPSGRLAERAAFGGSLGTLQWLHERDPAAEWGTRVIDNAARNGHLDVVLWLHRARNDGCSQEAIDRAAKEGHLEMVRWLLDNRTEGCSRGAIVEAARNGHLAILQLLHERCPHLFQGMPTYSFESVADLATLQWLHAHSLISSTTMLLTSLIQAGNVRCVVWASTTLGIAFTPRLLAGACEVNSREITAFILQQPGIEITDEVVETAVQRQCLDALAVLFKHDARWIPVSANAAAARNDGDMTRWLQVRYPGSVTQRTLQTAVENRAVDAVRMLLNSEAQTQWNVAMFDTMRVNHELRRLLNEYRTRSLSLK